MEQALTAPKPKVVRLPTNITQRRLRLKAFARKFAETMDSAEAYREIYRPATNPQPGDKTKGDRLLKLPEVQKLVGELIQPALVAMNVDHAFALRRLIETIDSDITDYAEMIVPGVEAEELMRKNSGFMSLLDMRELLPVEKRRLIKKYKVTYDQLGMVKSREIELEPKQPALELLAKMRGWVQGDTNVVVDGDAMLALLEHARNSAITRTTEARASYMQSRTAGQINRPANAQLNTPIEGTLVPVEKKPDVV